MLSAFQVQTIQKLNIDFDAIANFIQIDKLICRVGAVSISRPNFYAVEIHMNLI